MFLIVCGFFLGGRGGGIFMTEGWSGCEQNVVPIDIVWLGTKCAPYRYPIFRTPVLSYECVCVCMRTCVGGWGGGCVYMYVHVCENGHVECLQHFNFF